MEEIFIRIGKEGLYMVMLLSAPPVLAGLLTGLIVSVLQAATQIQEQTVAFVPKLLAIFLSLLLFGYWMLSHLVAYTYKLFYQFPQYIH